MQRKKSYTLDIILPILREEENIEKVIVGIQKHVKTPHRILAVWQDADDPTLPILKQLVKKHPNLFLVKSKDGIGVIPAITSGIAATKAPAVVIMMADLSDDPKTIDIMVAKIKKGYDIVCGTRYSLGGKRMGGGALKSILSNLACSILTFLTDIPTTDITNAFKCYTRSFLVQTPIESTGGFEYSVELILKAKQQGLQITDVPTIWRERKFGKSKFQLFSWLPHYIYWYIVLLFKL